MRSIHAALLLGLTGHVPLVSPALANSGPPGSELCQKAAATAAAHSGVPYDVLLTISVVETGRDGLPWPWTVNIGGEGHWLKTAEEAEALVEAALEQGLTNVDLGCFQLNLYWHAGAFQSAADMLDPQRNATYAAEYLAEKYAETGDWSAAAAAYHSATPEYAEAYQTRFDATWASLSGTDQDAPPDREPAMNRYPLLTAGLGGSAGSLVPLTTGGLRLIGGP